MDSLKSGSPQLNSVSQDSTTIAQTQNKNAVNSTHSDGHFISSTSGILPQGPAVDKMQETKPLKAMSVSKTSEPLELNFKLEKSYMILYTFIQHNEIDQKKFEQENRTKPQTTAEKRSAPKSPRRINLTSEMVLEIIKDPENFEKTNTVYDKAKQLVDVTPHNEDFSKTGIRECLTRKYNINELGNQGVVAPANILIVKANGLNNIQSELEAIIEKLPKKEQYSKNTEVLEQLSATTQNFAEKLTEKEKEAKIQNTSNNALDVQPQKLTQKDVKLLKQFSRLTQKLSQSITKRYTNYHDSDLPEVQKAPEKKFDRLRFEHTKPIKDKPIKLDKIKKLTREEIGKLAANTNLLNKIWSSVSRFITYAKINLNILRHGSPDIANLNTEDLDKQPKSSATVGLANVRTAKKSAVSNFDPKIKPEALGGQFKAIQPRQRALAMENYFSKIEDQVLKQYCYKELILPNQNSSMLPTTQDSIDESNIIYWLSPNDTDLGKEVLNQILSKLKIPLSDFLKMKPEDIMQSTNLKSSPAA